MDMRIGAKPQGTGNIASGKNDTATAIKAAVEGKYAITTANNPQAYKAVADSVRAELSNVLTSEDDAKIIAFIQSVSGVVGPGPIIGAETMDAVTLFTRTASQYKSDIPREKTMAGLKAISGIKDKPAEIKPETAKDALANLVGSSLWEAAVTDIKETGRGSRIVQGGSKDNKKESVDSLAASLKALGMLPSDKKFDAYNGVLIDTMRKFNLLTRNPQNLAKMDSLSREVGEATLKNIQKALELSSQGKNWRDPIHWQ